MGLVRRIVVFTLLLTLSLIGLPLPAHAASGEETPPLTFNGRPLSELLHGRATGAPFPLPARDGQISGVVVDEDGRPVVEHAVQLTRVFSISGNRAEQISGTGMTNVEGGFSFSGLQLSDYEIKVLARISDFAVVPYPPDQSSRPEFAGLRREKPHHGG